MQQQIVSYLVCRWWPYLLSLLTLLPFLAYTSVCEDREHCPTPPPSRAVDLCRYVWSCRLLPVPFDDGTPAVDRVQPEDEHDHPTPVSLRTHTREPVPFAIYSSTESADYVERFDEAAAKEGIFGLVEGHKLMNLLIK